MPELAKALVTASPSPTGYPLDVSTAGRTLVILAVGAMVVVFMLTIASLVRRGKDIGPR